MLLRPGAKRQRRMFKKILIANRGEIALRVICACKELGIKTVAVYSDADRNSLHVRFADEAVCIGPPRSAESYLNIPAVISAAEITGVDAIHPGYGLLSENANFAEVCETSHIKFIGPPPDVIRLMGEKEKARMAMKQANVPILPGSEGVIANADEAREWAKEIGYPVIVKASAGGGGRGMRVIRKEEELENLFNSAQAEAAAAFGNGNLYMEKFIEQPRHIEFQVLGDLHGKVISLGERECSIQRRHQKLLEESPSTQVTEELRQQIGKKLSECLSQILLAAGAKLGDIIPRLDRKGQRGHAIECRINAEHPEKFTPSAGKIKTFHTPGGLGIRVDTAAYAEGVIPPYYDSLIAKLISHGKDRGEAIMRMRRALEMFIVEGIHTTIQLHRLILADPDFQAGKFDTKYMERFLAKLQEERTQVAPVLA